MESSTESHPSLAVAGVDTVDLAERLRRSRRSTDWGLLVLCTLVVFASMVLTPADEAVSLYGWEIPPLCIFSNLTGMDCLGCGLTRSFTYIGHGDLPSALDRHLLGPIFYILVLSQVPLRAWRLWRTRTIGVTATSG
jgi:hypothetical protein